MGIALKRALHVLSHLNISFANSNYYLEGVLKVIKFLTALIFLFHAVLALFSGFSSHSMKSQAWC